MHIKKLEDQTILLTAPVMIPNKPDCDFNRGKPPLTTPQVKSFKESFEKYHFIDSEHEFTVTGRKRGEKYKSHLLEDDTTFENETTT